MLKSLLLSRHKALEIRRMDVETTLKRCCNNAVLMSDWVKTAEKRKVICRNSKILVLVMIAYNIVLSNNIGVFDFLACLSS